MDGFGFAAANNGFALDAMRGRSMPLRIACQMYYCTQRPRSI
jgi:hypothetical protein